ncbi:MAG: DUF6364 family protein [Thermodesulfobacteriota bacterium]|nr:DUF6364 family protein [Thermodesulfobacteriota bacterium]
MPNITLSVKDDVIKKVRKIAVDRNTTLTSMVREFLCSVAAKDQQERENIAHGLSMTFKAYSIDMGKQRWTREELHERR